MTMKDLAEELQISTAYLSDIVNGNRKAAHIRKEIIKILNLKGEENSASFNKNKN